MRNVKWLGVVVTVLVAGLLPAVASAQGSAAPPAQALVYQNAQVNTQIDVNGVAAVQLVGAGLDAIVAQVQEQAKALPPVPMEAGTGTEVRAGLGAQSMILLALPVIEPVKDAIKSLERITVLDMKPAGEVNRDEFVNYYSKLMGEAGWVPLATVRDKSGTAVVAMIAPEAKGIFLAVNNRNQLVAALVTTTKPIGDLVSQVVQQGGKALPMLLSQLQQRPQPPAPRQMPAKAPSKPSKGK